MTRITLIHPKCNPDKIKSKIRGHPSYWLCFGENIDKIVHWEKIFRNHSKRLNVSRSMEDIYNIVCKRYSGKMADLGIKYKKKYPEWWLSPISEKNGWPPKSVVNECILEYLKRLVSECDEEIICITSSTFNLIETKKLSSRENISCSIYGYRYYLSEFVKLYFHYSLEFLYLGFKFIKNKMALYRYYNNEHHNAANSSIVLLRTYCNESSFQDNGKFKDRVFGDLKKKLEEQGLEVIYHPNLSMIQNKEKVYKWLSASHEDDFWILENYLTYKDLFMAYMNVVKQFALMHRLGHSVYLNLESSLVITTGENYLKSLVPQKLAQQGIKPLYILFDWENKAYEKYMCVLSKSYLPESIMVGYISGIPFPTGPRTNLSKKEAMIVPLPDKIVCCSQYVYDWMTDVGFTETKLVVGPSIRQNHVFDDHIMSSDEFIMVALPLNYNLSFELVSEMILFARHNTNYDILLKPHPFLKIESIIEANEPLPANVFISNEDMSALLQKCRYFVYVGPTTTACEAFVLGKYVCRYVSNSNFSLDCLHFKFNDMIFSFTESIELEEYISNTSKADNGEPYKGYIFNQVEEGCEEAFLN